MSVLEALSGLAVRHLPRRQVLALRERYQGARKRMYPLLRAVYGTFDAADLRLHLADRIGDRFEILMVHSSFNHMLPMYTGTALDLVRMLVDFVGESRTLAMPAFFLGDATSGGVVEHYRSHPVYDARRTPSQMGIVTELFRRLPGVSQSRHPTHRVTALGPLASALTHGHEAAGSTFGRGTPFEFMASHDTCIVGIGKPVDVCSQIHHVEDLLEDAFPVPGHVDVVSVTVRDAGGEVPFDLRWRTFDWPRNVFRIRDMMPRDQLQEWTFHHVPMFATRARDVTDALVHAAKFDGKTLYLRR